MFGFHQVIFFFLLLSNGLLACKFDCLDKILLSAPQVSHLGAIVDSTTISGKEEVVAIEMAMADFCARMAAPCPILHVRNSRGDPARAAHLARNLINKLHVRALIGLSTWQETVSVADLANKSRVPIISFAKEIPTWATTHWPFLVNGARNQLAQMKAVAAIIQSWQWKKVNIIYEDDNTPTENGIAFLISSIHGAQLQDCRVFVLHCSVSLAIQVFAAAKRLKMMEEGFVWITTTSVSNHIDSLNASTVYQMQGVLGVKSTHADGFRVVRRRFEDFQLMLRQKYPEHQNLATGFYSLQAYDAAWSLFSALYNGKPWLLQFNTSLKNSGSCHGQEILKMILQSDFKLDPAQRFQIINVVGKSYRELGYWFEGLGFSKGNDGYNQSMKFLGNVIWGGDSLSVPRGELEVAKDDQVKPLRIGVPADSTSPEFVKVTFDQNQNKSIYTGFSIDVFIEVQNMKDFPQYEFVQLNGTYDSMLQKVLSKEIDAMVADTAIVSHRYQYVDFSQPYTEWGIQILILNQKKKSGRFWLFVKPFKPLTWVAIVFANIYHGAAIWLIEKSESRHNIDENCRLPFFIELGTMILKTFITVFSTQGKAKRKLSLMILAGWLFLALIITQSYTASLSSLLTVERFDPPTVDFDFLRRTQKRVGCDADSFVVDYLKEQNYNVVQIHNEDEYPQALMNGTIDAAILEVPYVKLFLAKYCDNLTTSGSTIRIGGFGFAFPKQSPYLPNISEAIISLAEKGWLEWLENSMLSTYNCSSSSSPFDSHGSLDIQSFLGVIVVSGLTSTLALSIFCFNQFFPTQDQEYDQQGGGQELGDLRRDNFIINQPDNNPWAIRD